MDGHETLHGANYSCVNVASSHHVFHSVFGRTKLDSFIFFINYRCPRFRPVIQPLPLLYSCRKFYLASQPGLSIRCSFMSPCYLSTVSFLRPFMAPNLAASQHDLIRDIILDESLTIYFASGWRVKRIEASGIFLMELFGICWNY